MFGKLSGLDATIIVTYLLALLAFGFYLARGERNGKEYFLAGRNMSWLWIGASIFAANISAEHFIGLAGAGATKGLVVGQFEWIACLAILLLGWVFTPIYLRRGVVTIPEFLEQRYNKVSRTFLTVVSIVAYVFTKLSVTLFAGGLLLREIMGWEMATSGILMIVVAGTYAVTGGLRAIIHIDLIQAVILILGAGLLTLFGLHAVGGFEGLRAALPADYFSMFRPMDDPEFPWTGIVFGAPILAIWYWCTDQYIVQRILSAKNIQHAESASILAGYLKILPVFILVLPGLIAAVLLKDSTIGDRAFPALIAGDLLPIGVKGLVVAGLLAALMSSLASCFNSTATLFTVDIYSPRRPQASDRELVLVGKLATTAFITLAVLWIPFMKFMNSQIYIYLQTIQAYISPPITAVFLIALIWPRANGKAAITTLVAGAILGISRLILELCCKNGMIDNSWLYLFINMNFLHFAIFLFSLSVVMMILVTLFTEGRASMFISTETPASLRNGVIALMVKKASWNRINILFSIGLALTVVLLLAHYF